VVVSPVTLENPLSLGCGSPRSRFEGDVNADSDDGRALFPSQDAEVSVVAGKLMSRLGIRISAPLQPLTRQEV
jgi:hypothetical protein